MDLDFADIKPSLLSWLIVGLMAMSFISFAKFIMLKYPIPGFADMVKSV